MMTYDEFKEKIRDEIKDVLPERYENSEVEIHTVNKNNQQLDGLTISSPDGNPVIPTIYLNSFYESYQDGEYFNDILENIANIRTENEHKISLDVNSITDYEIAKDRILPIVVGAEKNAAMFADRPHRTMADLAVLYRVELGNDTRGTMSTPVTYRLLRQCINVNIKMYIFDHLRMYKFAHSSSCVIYSLKRYDFPVMFITCA